MNFLSFEEPSTNVVVLCKKYLNDKHVQDKSV